VLVFPTAHLVLAHLAAFFGGSRADELDAQADSYSEGLPDANAQALNDEERDRRRVERARIERTYIGPMRKRAEGMRSTSKTLVLAFQAFLVALAATPVFDGLWEPPANNEVFEIVDAGASGLPFVVGVSALYKAGSQLSAHVLEVRPQETLRQLWADIPLLGGLAGVDATSGNGVMQEAYSVMPR
jgi:hypothetical protein